MMTTDDNKTGGLKKYIVRPGQKVTHSTREEANAHAEKHTRGTIGMSILQIPPPPLTEYEEGDEIMLTDVDAESMPWAVCEPGEFEALASPSALVKKGYTKDEAESMAESMKAGREGRRAMKRDAAKRAAQPAAAFGMQPIVPGEEVNPRAAGKFPDDAKKHPVK